MGKGKGRKGVREAGGSGLTRVGERAGGRWLIFIVHHDMMGREAVLERSVSTGFVI